MRRLVRSELDEIEWQFRVPPQRAPVLDEVLLKVWIELASVQIRLALVPNRAADGLRDDGRDQPVMEAKRVVRVLIGSGVFRGFATSGFRQRPAVIEGGFAPCAQVTSPTATLSSSWIPNPN